MAWRCEALTGATWCGGEMHGEGLTGQSLNNPEYFFKWLVMPRKGQGRRGKDWQGTDWAVVK